MCPVQGPFFVGFEPQNSGDGPGLQRGGRRQREHAAAAHRAGRIVGREGLRGSANDEAGRTHDGPLDLAAPLPVRLAEPAAHVQPRQQSQ